MREHGWEKPSPNADPAGGWVEGRGTRLGTAAQEGGRGWVQEEEEGREGSEMLRECRHCHSLFCAVATEGRLSLPRSRSLSLSLSLARSLSLALSLSLYLSLILSLCSSAVLTTRCSARWRRKVRARI